QVLIGIYSYFEGKVDWEIILHLPVTCRYIYINMYFITMSIVTKYVLMSFLPVLIYKYMLFKQSGKQDSDVTRFIFISSLSLQIYFFSFLFLVIASIAVGLKEGTGPLAFLPIPWVLFLHSKISVSYSFVFLY
ncbi:hypothetical protein PENTCL1PPCAC_21577, partial [Pristionchus entomophagus]